MTAMMTYLRAVLAAYAPEGDDGQTMVEYGLILAGVALVAVAAVFLVGGAINTQFQAIVAELTPGP